MTCSGVGSPSTLSTLIGSAITIEHLHLNGMGRPYWPQKKVKPPLMSLDTIGALPRAEGGLWTPEARLAAARASPCAPNDGLPVGQVTRTLAHAAEHENNKRCGRHIWLQWTMIVGGKAPLPQRMFGTVHQASRL